MDNHNINPHTLSIWQILDYMENDPKPTSNTNIPQNLQVSIPPLLPPSNQNTNTHSTNEDFRKNHNIHNQQEITIIPPILNEKTQQLKPSKSPTINPSQMITNTNKNTNTNTKTINRLDSITNTLDLTIDTQNDQQSEEDVDMTNPSKPRKPSPRTDTSRSRSRSRKPRSRSSQNIRKRNKI